MARVIRVSARTDSPVINVRPIGTNAGIDPAVTEGLASTVSDVTIAFVGQDSPVIYAHFLHVN